MSPRKKPAGTPSIGSPAPEKISLLATDQLADLLAIADLSKRLQKVESRIAEALDQFRSALRPQVFSFLTGPAKRIRATMLIATAELAGTFDKRVVDAAAAIELVQMGSLIHDDIIEGAPTRRGNPTLNAVESVAIALVVGDLVLAQAGLLATEMHEEASKILADGMAHMAAGQLDELRDAFDLDRTLDRYRAAAQAKTGSLFATACRLGGMCGRMSEKKLDALTAYGSTFGLMYQMTDDILDVVGDPKLLGKPVGVDLATGTYTAPLIKALAERGGKTLAALLKRRRTEALADALERVRKSGAIEDAEKAVAALAREASDALAPFARQPTGRGLQRLPTMYSEWALRELRDKSLVPKNP